MSLQAIKNPVANFGTRFNKIIANPFRAYQILRDEWLRRRLNEYGLLYDDIFHEEKDPIVMAALQRLPPELFEMRMRRLRRAIDMDMKHTHIPESMFEHQGDPLAPENLYLAPIIKQCAREFFERENFLNHYTELMWRGNMTDKDNSERTAVDIVLSSRPPSPFTNLKPLSIFLIF